METGFCALRSTLRLNGNWWRRRCCGISGRHGRLERRRNLRAGSAVPGLAMIGMLETIKALIRNTYQLVGLFAVLRKSGNSVIHADADAQLQWLEHFRKNGFHAAAERQRLFGICLR